MAVGADTTPSGSATPSVGGLPSPVVYVRVGAQGGDGSPSRPFGELSAAARSLTLGGTLALAAGTHRLSETVTLSANTALVGVGPAGGTSLACTRGQACVAVAPGAVGVVIRDLSLRFPTSGASPGAGPTDTGLDVGGGARVELRNVSIEDAWNGLHASGSVDASRLSVLRAARNGIDLVDGAVGRFSSLLVRDGFYQGIAAGGATRAARLHVTDGAVLSNADRGISLYGPTVTGTGATRCEAAGPVGDGGDLDCLSRVSVQGNGLDALRSDGARHLEGRMLSLSGTRAREGNGEADGASLTGGSRLSLDPELASEAAMGHGSIVVGNGRAGVLAKDARTVLAVSGARVANNAGPGVFVVDGATAQQIGFSRVDGNGAVGIGAGAGAIVVSIQCNGIANTRLASIPSSMGGSAEIGDGLSIDRGSPGVVVIDNHFDANARFGAVLHQAGGRFEGNSGRGNRYGVRAYDSAGLALSESESDAIRGSEPVPSALPPLARSP